MAHCRSCDAEVIFVPSAKTGKNMILDAKPKKGVVVTIGGGAGRDPSAGPGIGDPASRDTVANADTSLSAPSAHVVDVYTDHHATCPRAADWR